MRGYDSRCHQPSFPRTRESTSAYHPSSPLPPTVIPAATTRHSRERGNPPLPTNRHSALPPPVIPATTTRHSRERGNPPQPTNHHSRYLPPVIPAATNRHSRERGNPPQQISLYKSNHFGLSSSINSIFHARLHFLSAFSLVMALSIDP